MTAIPNEVLGLKVEVVRSIRRTAALHIVGSDLQVRIPKDLGDERAAAILQQKRPWIRSKVADLQGIPPQKTKELVSGESFPFLGRNYRLKVEDGHQVGVCLSGGYLKATIRPSEQGDQRQQRIKQYLDSWYKDRATERLIDKTDRYAKEIGVSPSGISVRNFKSRWGSCDSRGQLVFNWNIIKAPHAVADYVVVHELCHLLHPNHSSDFWSFVERFVSAYQQHRVLLNQQGSALL